jgi:hypothetical protein
MTGSEFVCGHCEGASARTEQAKPSWEKGRAVARTTKGLLDTIYFSSGSEAEKGSRFERLIVAYLQTAGQYAACSATSACGRTVRVARTRPTPSSTPVSV